MIFWRGVTADCADEADENAPIRVIGATAAPSLLLKLAVVRGRRCALDHLWRETMGLAPADTKEEPLRRVISVLEASGKPYAVIAVFVMPQACDT